MVEFSFNKIPTNSESFISFEESNSIFLQGFYDYAADETIKSGKAKEGKSGKASSYHRHLIRLILGYKMNFNESLSDLTLFKTYKKLEFFINTEEFNSFNKETNHYYSASMKCYLRYLAHIYSYNEELEDDKMNKKINFEVHDKYHYYKISNMPINKPEKDLRKEKSAYKRDYEAAYFAKIQSEWKCEYNDRHKTFTNCVDNKPYMEAHHLIPMAAQDYFNYSIDFSDNIICLCPTCHRCIHNAAEVEKKVILEKLFNKRSHLFIKYGIEINRANLFSMYGILD